MRLPDALLPRTAAPDRARLMAARRERLRRLRRLAWHWRYAAAALCCGLAATTTVQLLRPPPPPTVDVVVTARAVLAGAELTADDVVTRPVAESLVPEGAARSVSGVLGRVAAVGLPAGMPLLTGLVSDGVAASVPPGTVVVPVRLADAAVGGLLRPGDRVDLLTADPRAGEGPVYLARRALVLPVPAGRSAAAPASGLLGGGEAQDPGITLVAVPAADAAALSAVAGLGVAWGGAVTAVLVP
ncbi:SAF domain-containing protein [Antribacter sp. KLBMP9083]|uniref:SAF domain-containing protein n=1 Tax=Antribacter soli TaxID=2910976 RepID=A0AA41QB22_9MICO|nr:SAF domain-containing protein [Antribacter soli]MCF4119857.1 SAF domain-containing protein [Antribacter soli]